MSFLSQINARYIKIEATQKSYYFGDDAIPASLMAILKQGKDNVKIDYDERSNNVSTITKDPSEIQGMLVYSLGDYFSGPKRFFVFYMDNGKMIWDRGITKSSGGASWRSRSIEFTHYFMDWHKQLRFYPKPITYKKYSEIKNVEKFVDPEKKHTGGGSVDEIKSEFANLGFTIIKVTKDSKNTYFEFAPIKLGKQVKSLRLSYYISDDEHVFKPEYRYHFLTDGQPNPNPHFEGRIDSARDSDLKTAVQKSKALLDKLGRS